MRSLVRVYMQLTSVGSFTPGIWRDVGGSRPIAHGEIL